MADQCARCDGSGIRWDDMGAACSCRTTPISDHTDVTREQLQELVDRMVADGRIPRTGAHYVSVVASPKVRREAYKGKVRCETCKGTGWTLCGERFCEHCHCPDCHATGLVDA